MPAHGTNVIVLITPRLHVSELVRSLCLGSAGAGNPTLRSAIASRLRRDVHRTGVLVCIVLATFAKSDW